MRAVLAGMVRSSSGVKSRSLQRDDRGAQLTRDRLQDGVQVQDPEVLQDLADGFAGALELAQHLLVLQVVNQALVFDQGEQRIGNVVWHRTCDLHLALDNGFGFGARRRPPVRVPGVSPGS